MAQHLREIVREETLALRKETRAADVLVTPDQVAAMDQTDRIFLMQAGRSIQSGGSAKLFRKPADFNVDRLFSDVNEHSGRVSLGDAETPLGRFVASGFATVEEVVGHSAAAGPRSF
jgi:iron(III) transport system ATP-binding protein